MEGKITQLQETLADERDAIYTVEQKLNQPFALISCQCLNLTDELKEQLQAQIAQTESEVSSLNAAIHKHYENPACDDTLNCSTLAEISLQSKRLSEYL